MSEKEKLIDSHEKNSDLGINKIYSGSQFLFEFWAWEGI